MSGVYNFLCMTFCIVLLTGCATQTSSTSRLDSSGLTVVTLADAIVFVRPVRTLAAGARDYAYIRPIEINRMGIRQYYLWIALASTVDRDLAGLVPMDAVAIALVVDENPMVLPLRKWDTTLDIPPYDSTAPVYATLAAHTSLDQIHRIASANEVELHFIIDTGNATHYQQWQGAWSSLSDFAGID